MLNETKKNNTAGRQRKKERRIFPGVIVIAFLASAIIFFLLLNIEKNLLSDYEKVTVWVAAEDLPRSLEIQIQNLNKYFKQVEVDKTRIPEHVVGDINTLAGKSAALMIPAGTILVEPMFTDNEKYIKGLTEPVIVGCKAEDLYQVASGILRKGDMVNIYTVNDELGEAYLLWSDVMIYQTFDNSGNQIAAEDTTTAAARINLLMEEWYTEQFYTELHRGSLRMVKLWDS